MMQEWHQLVPMSGHVEESEIAKNLQLIRDCNLPGSFFCLSTRLLTTPLKMIGAHLSKHHRSWRKKNKQTIKQTNKQKQRTKHTPPHHHTHTHTHTQSQLLFRKKSNTFQ